MRRVTIGRTGIETSCLGFGCASLGSRVGAAAGLRAMAAAFEAGITWFDLAPPYGDGKAEVIAGPFLSERRDKVQICSKVGLATPVSAGGLKGALMPAARVAIRAVPALRGRLRRRREPPPLPLTPELVTGTIETILRRLGTDHLDVYALHSVAPEALTDPVLRALEAVVASGKARAVGMASDEAAGLAAISAVEPFGVVQCAVPALGVPDRLLPAAEAAGVGAVLHSIFGIDGSLAALRARAAASPDFCDAIPLGRADPERALGRALLARAFALNPEGVVLASMFAPDEPRPESRTRRRGPRPGRRDPP